ncbi:MAG: LytTR family transcriptional regulator, partial [Xanthomonadales bacterium]|nr:LytTR family transcriptional regulator [Xanthomonadales bacterium]
VELHLAERCVLHRVALSRLEEHLDADCFLRVHRTALVRRNLVRGLRSLGEGSYQLWLDGGDRVPVSERHLPEVRAQLELGTEAD